jgi:hypothetical protein
MTQVHGERAIVWEQDMKTYKGLCKTESIFRRNEPLISSMNETICKNIHVYRRQTIHSL